VIVLLDSGPLGLVTNPRATPESQQCNEWLVAILASGLRVLVPEITDYEVRRELLRADKPKGVAWLDQLKVATGYVPITTATMLQAAESWAQARKQGQPTADNRALDGDVILAAQAVGLAAVENISVVVATDNINHLARFTLASRWQDISP
jgi:predicted nucleic acid-binding protein